MTTKDIMSKWKQVGIGISIIGFLCLVHPVCVQAAQFDFDAKVVELKAKFPHGKYWNHVGMTTDNSDSYTESPCSLHKTNGIHIYGTGGCTCNHFADSGHVSATQCMGFANKLGHDVFGETTWTTNYVYTVDQMAGISKGDIIRINGNHSAFVINRNGNILTIGESNYPKDCQITWDRQIDITATKITYYERANNYASVMSGTQMPVQSGTTEVPSTGDGSTTGIVTEGANSAVGTTEASGTDSSVAELELSENGQPYTGWKNAEDGVHFIYYENGKLITKDWVTVDKMKYYLDENGYRVVGFYDVDKKSYYFNESGVMLKKEWFQYNGETYYVNEDGLVLKSQWLLYEGSYVYVTEDGSIARKELVTIDSQTYLFNANGKRSKGFKKYNGKYYYCNSKGVIQKKKWITKNGKKYYMQKSGVRAQSKLVKIGKYRYYFNNKGYMIKNKNITYDGERYRADSQGHCTYLGAE